MKKILKGKEMSMFHKVQSWGCSKVDMFPVCVQICRPGWIISCLQALKALTLLPYLHCYCGQSRRSQSLQRQSHDNLCLYFWCFLALRTMKKTGLFFNFILQVFVHKRASEE